jgi:putative iron-only hydrogenase system regulator
MIKALLKGIKMGKRVGFVGIIISDRINAAEQVNKILSEFGKSIVVRTGVPDVGDSSSVITLVIKATTDELGALTGKLGAIEGVSVKSMLATVK